MNSIGNILPKTNTSCTHSGSCGHSTKVPAFNQLLCQPITPPAVKTPTFSSQAPKIEIKGLFKRPE